MIRQRGTRHGQPELAWPSWAIATVLGLSILFGGGGAEGPANNGFIYAVSAFLMLALGIAHWHGSRRLPGEAAVPVWLLVGLLLIGALQLIPLPPWVWRGLPGRELAVSSLTLVSAENSWRPLSLDAEATRRAIAALLLPAAIMIAALGSNLREILLLLRTVLACALVSSIVGLLQIGLGFPTTLMFYEGLADLPSGVFANVNHQATLLLSAIVCVGLVVRLRRIQGWPPRRFDVAWVLLPLFALMVLATTSRAGSLLLVVAIPASLILGLGRKSLPLWMAGIVGIALFALLIAALWPSADQVARGQALFTDPERAAILPDVLFTLGQYWPWGSGLGTFVAVFATHENLDVAGRMFVNHAHNDVMEWLVETGLPGAIWLLVAIAAIAGRLFRLHFRKPSGELQTVSSWAGVLILLVLGLHSVVDYPLRMASVAAIGGIAIGLVFAPFSDRPRTIAASKRRIGMGFAVGAVVMLLVTIQVVRMFVAQAAVRNGDGAASAAVRQDNGTGLALAAEEELARQRTGPARSLAAKAIRQSPLSVRAVRVLAIADDLGRRGGMPAWRVASAMGWRDSPTQFWAMQQAIANQEYATAAIRADAFLRTAYEGLRDRTGLIRAAAANAPFRKELVARLMRDPPWKAAFFNVSAGMPEDQLKGVILVLQDLAASASPPIAESARTIRILIARKQYSQAIALYRTIAGPDDKAASMADLAFDRSTNAYINQSNPFDWSLRAKGGTVTEVEQSGNRRVLIVETDGRDRFQPVRRYAALAPGSYRLGYAARGTAESPLAVRLAVSCVDQAKPLATSPSDPLGGTGFESRQFDFTIPASCPLQLVVFQTELVDRPAKAEFADLSLEAQ